ncbi:DUF1754-domain-containing protein [Cylindrobasidium torrendii FP15055 ss-10]|uniref:DUF1754-domain-containing protein n=1 Tax=Cylindrobasidium torrendii FP15055 ss-10 TaxID=1314674 RepID=A0A0D7BHT1_9AGAR|nr:DUF1754-domain-containing protein [Cylindrobasidium torrendii FP15055 ss-10]
MSSDYSFRPGGSLKLKGTVADGGVIKKKKKKSKDKDPSSKTSGEKAREKEKLREALYNDASASGSGNGSDSGAPSSSSSRKTEAEKRFEEVQRERLLKRVAKLAGKTHKDRVNEFNNHLESLSEHHDIPKVGPG